MPRIHSRRRRRPARPARRGRRATPHVVFSRRMTTLTVIFVCVCLCYAAILVSLQFKGDDFSIFTPTGDLPEGGSVRTVTVQAVRGEIYDRNGKPLVTNRYAYDLELDYTSFRADKSLSARNEALLSLLSAVAKTSASLPCLEDFPLEGTYPDLHYAQGALDASTGAGARLARVLLRLGLSPATSAEALVNYYLDSYELSARTDGIPLYSDEQIDALLRIYYDMDATAFQPAVAYTLAQDVPSSLISSQKELSLSGVQFSVRAERVYHYEGYATHILGRVGQIFEEDWAYYSAMGYPMNALVGISGCESAFESILHGTDGQMKVTLDAQGRIISRETVVQPIAGQDIRLTIDIDVQMAAEDALRAKTTQNASGVAVANGGAVVAMLARTGEYLAVASAPTYDAGVFLEQYDALVADPCLPLVNRALSATYRPDDLMHPLTALIGLSKGVISASTLWEDNGFLTVQNQTLALCPKLTSLGASHGSLGPSVALRDGCSVFFGTLGTLLDSYDFTLWETALGIGQSTGIELGDTVGSDAGALAAPPKTMALAAIGESGAKCTPAQLCSMLATLLNGGDRPSGQLLSQVRDFTTGEILYRKSPEILSSVDISQDTRQTLLRAMKNAASLNMAAVDSTQALKNAGIEIGLLNTLSPAAQGADHALTICYGVPSNQLTSLTSHEGVSVCVVLENAGNTAQNYDVAAQTLDAWFLK